MLLAQESDPRSPEPKSGQRPPGPKRNPIFGNLFQYNRDPLGFSEQCAREYGGIVRLRFGPFQTYFVSEPALVDEVLNRQSHCFVKGISVQSLRGTLGQGLLTSDGAFWKRQRRLIQPAFHRERIAAYGEIMVRCTEQMLHQWQDSQIHDVHEEMMRLTLVIVAKSLFGADIEEKSERIGTALDAIMAHFLTRMKTIFLLPEWLPTPDNLRFRKARQQLDDIVYPLIRQQRASERDSENLLSMLLKLRDEDGIAMSDEEIRDEVVTLILAGHETTALTLSWTWMLLSQHSDIEAQLLKELQTVLNGRSPTVADLPRLQYTTMVIKESMRLYPPAWSTSRQVIQPCQIGGYWLEPGAAVFVHQWVTHRNPHFFEEPETFQPERWANGLEQRLPRGAYFPFGDGPRVCIGKGFAMMEAVLILAAIAKQFQLTLVPDHPIELQPTITLRPKYGLKMKLSQR